MTNPIFRPGAEAGEAANRSKAGPATTPPGRRPLGGSDPVKMYLREMGLVSLLTREGEVEIAKRIEDR